ncbi:MAG: hypothetical protein WDW38_008780 [Sanguina aurantia]
MCASQGRLPRKHGNATESVILHVWLRVLVNDSQLHVKGFSFMESLDEFKQGGLLLAQADALDAYKGSLTLRCVDI